jgi:hypothetical protein
MFEYDELVNELTTDALFLTRGDRQHMLRLGEVAARILTVSAASNAGQFEWSDQYPAISLLYATISLPGA